MEGVSGRGSGLKGSRGFGLRAPGAEMFGFCAYHRHANG